VRDKKIIFVVEKKPIFSLAADKAERRAYSGRVYDRKDFFKPNDAKAYMKKRLMMNDAEEVDFVVFGFGSTDFSDVKDRKGNPALRYKGIITPLKKPKPKKWEDK